MDELVEKFRSVSFIIADHNKAVDQSQQFDDAALISNIKAIGGTSVERLRSLSYEDILACFPERDPSPILLAKAIAGVFRGLQDAATRKRINVFRAEMMTPAELVDSFDPEEPESPVGKRLRDMSRGEAFIVYDAGRNLNAEATLKLLQEVRQGFPGRKDYTLGEQVVAVYKVGELPDNLVEENPLYPGRALRPDGTCDQTGRSWTGVPLEVRQLVRVIVTSEVSSVDFELAHRLIDVAVGGDALKHLRARHREAALKFDMLDKTGRLPTLRMALRREPAGVGLLQGGKRVDWK